VRAHPDSERWLFECHPELSFYALSDGSALAESKHSAAGLLRRLKLVRARFADAEERLVSAPWNAKSVELSDLLDAYAALSTALVCAAENYEQLGEGERDAEGVLMRMVLSAAATAGEEQRRLDNRTHVRLIRQVSTAAHPASLHHGDRDPALRVAGLDACVWVVSSAAGVEAVFAGADAAAEYARGLGGCGDPVTVEPHELLSEAPAPEYGMLARGRRLLAALRAAQ